MVRAGPSRGGSRLEPARFGSYGKPIGGLGCFRIYRSRSVFASGLGSCDRRHKLPPDYPSFFGHPEVCLSCGVSSGVGGRTEMIEFLTHMPVNTVIFVTVVVLGLAAILIALRS
jgi:hypothetical protein